MRMVFSQILREKEGYGVSFFFISMGKWFLEKLWRWGVGWGFANSASYSITLFLLGRRAVLRFSEDGETFLSSRKTTVDFFRNGEKNVGNPEKLTDV